MKISLIVATDEKNGIGKSGQMPWHISEDFKRFKELTFGHPVIMGRKTWESLPVKPLPGRTNIVVTREELKVDLNSVIVHNNLNLAIADAKRIGLKDGVDEVFIIGGGEIFRQSINLADKLYITKVKGNFHADTFFPDYSNFKKQVLAKDSTDGKYNYTFLELEK